MTGADIVQAKYDRLEEIAQRFGNLADAMSADRTRMRQASDRLTNGGWEGRGVERFSSEMNSDLLPGMRRLVQALREGQRVTVELSAMLQQAEEEAAAVYRSDSLGLMALGGGMARAALGGGGSRKKRKSGGARGAGKNSLRFVSASVGGGAPAGNARKGDGKLRRGSKGAAVKKLQQRLKKLGYLTGAADGMFGPGTEAAVKRFQGRNKVGGGSGVVGPATLKQLNSASAIRAPKPTGPKSTNLSHAGAVKKLAAVGIDVVSSGKCSDRSQGNCTSLQGIRRTSVEGLIRFKKAHPSFPITVTGGTEVGHSKNGAHRHDNGWKIDIARTAPVTSFIKSNYPFVGIRGGDGARLYKDKLGNIYAEELSPPHWDIQYFK